MHFRPLLGLGVALLSSTPALPFQGQFLPPRFRTTGMPVVSQLADLECPTLHRWDTMVASLRAAGWRDGLWTLTPANGTLTRTVAWSRPYRYGERTALTTTHNINTGEVCVLPLPTPLAPQIAAQGPP